MCISSLQKMTDKEIALLAENHWGYVREVLEDAGADSDQLIERIGFHYRTAMVHGFKHGAEERKK